MTGKSMLSCTQRITGVKGIKEASSAPALVVKRCHFINAGLQKNHCEW
jgi:hypothetical protein